MKTVGIVAEYNPFHRGHAYQIAEARRLAKADAVAICMGGNFTQRGGYALINKFARAEAAMACGADLVMELPVGFAVASAERFAYGGMSILSSFCDVISFGSECDDAALLMETAAYVAERDFVEKVKEVMSDGSSFAAARERVLEEYFPAGAGLLSQPNSILAIEYIKALGKLGASSEILPIRRIGAGHDASLAEQGIASASAIRKMPLAASKAYLPPASYSILFREKQAGRLMDTPSLWEASMLASLRRLSADALSCLPEVREGLENRLYQAIHTETNIEPIVNHANSRRYPSSRIRRSLMHAFLNITSEEIARMPSPLYLRVLAFNDTGRKVLASLRGGSLPVLMRGGAYRTLSPEARAMFEREIVADDVYTSLYPRMDVRRAFSDLCLSPHYQH